MTTATQTKGQNNSGATLQTVAPEPPRIEFGRVTPEAYRGLLELDRYARAAGLDASLIELVKLRASLINGCAYCVDMHTKDARAAGESEQRLYAVPVWRETPFYTARERAALSWAEAVTDVKGTGVPDAAYAEVKAQFDEQEIVALTMAVIAINGWNRFAISMRSRVGSYSPPTNRNAGVGRTA
jgi:AhpD family alkylhydroperoxidase